MVTAILSTETLDANIDARTSVRIETYYEPVTVHDLGPASLVGHVTNESLGGLGMLIPGIGDLSGKIGEELVISSKGQRRIAIVRHAGPNGRLGLEWKRHALRRRNLLKPTPQL